MESTQNERPLSHAEFARLAGFDPGVTEADEFDVMSFIRENAVQPEPSAHFTSNVIRRLRQQNVKRGIAYWSPALVGAGIAALAVLAILQMLNTPASPVNITNHEASRVNSRSVVFPDPNLGTNAEAR